VFMAVLGGRGTFVGPAVGALAFVLLQDWVMAATQYWRFVMGAVLVALVVGLPQGLAGAAAQLAARRSEPNR
jgi:branched-chain amino acid transport system permease protein